MVVRFTCGAGPGGWSGLMCGIAFQDARGSADLGGVSKLSLHHPFLEKISIQLVDKFCVGPSFLRHFIFKSCDENTRDAKLALRLKHADRSASFATDLLLQG
jgi:hypothetical protein